MIATSQRVSFMGLFQLFQSDRQLVLVFMLGVTVEACDHDNLWADVYICVQGEKGRNRCRTFVNSVNKKQPKYWKAFCRN